MGSNPRPGRKARCSGGRVLGAQAHMHSRLPSLCVKISKAQPVLRKKLLSGQTHQDEERRDELEIQHGPTPGASRGSGAGGAWSKMGG